MHTGSTPRARAWRSLRALAGAAALAAVLSACYPTITIQADLPVVTVRPASSGVLLYVRVPADRPRGGIEAVRTDGRRFHVPPGHYPPPGQCRVWNPDLPPGRQSPPGPCGVLERRVPAGSYLIYG